MKRFSAGLIVAALIAAGALASACTATPTAATVNGDSVPVSELNSQLGALNDTAAGQCLLQLQFPDANLTTIEGTGGSGTYVTDVATAVLNDKVSNLVSAQYAAAHGIHLTAADLSSARDELISSFQGEISEVEQQSAESGGGSTHCVQASGVPFTGTELLAALPAAERNDQIADQAVGDRLLAHGDDLSVAAVLNYYAANQSQFTVDCVSEIVVDSEAAANTVVQKLQNGASFASVAASSSIDSQLAESGGSLGCQYTESSVLQSLNLKSVTVGQPITPIQASDGSWEIYEVTSHTVIPVTSAEPTVRQDLERETANISRVSALLKVYAHRSSVWVNPQYGTWAGITIAVPKSPPTRFLQPSYLASSAVASTSAAG